MGTCYAYCSAPLLFILNYVFWRLFPKNTSTFLSDFPPLVYFVTYSPPCGTSLLSIIHFHSIQLFSLLKLITVHNNQKLYIAHAYYMQCIILILSQC